MKKSTKKKRVNSKRKKVFWRKGKQKLNTSINDILYNNPKTKK